MELKQLISEELNSFLKERQDRFPTFTVEQKAQWADDIEQQIIDTLEDIDIFYDNMPDDVEERCGESTGPEE